jgi:hypothetical protein
MIVDPRGASDDDYLRLLDAWRQVVARRDEILASIPRSIAALCAIDADVSPGPTPESVCFSLMTTGPGQVSISAQLSLPGDDDRSVELDLIAPDERNRWSFL